jgi:hypothetical protein
MARGLVACWLFNEGGGPPFELVRQINRAVQWNGATWTVGALGVSASFPGVTSYLQLGDATELGLPTSRATVLVRRRKTDTTLRASALFGLSGGTDRLGAHVPYSDGTVYWDFYDFNGANRLTWGGYPVSTAPETWAFVAGPSGSAIYFNGQVKASQGSAVTVRANPGSVLFEVNSGQGLVGTNGDLQEINQLLILDAEWSAAQVAEWHFNPYAFLTRPRPRRALVPPPPPVISVPIFLYA